jgi:hypothetical protein
MMQAADLGHLDHVPTFGWFGRSWDRTVVRERAVRAYLMAILQVGFENAPELPFMEHDHSIEAFLANRTHQPLDVGILPRRSRADQLLPDAHAFDGVHEGRSVDRISVPQ